ncbi:MAG TPA: hypothetical protein PLO51_02335, partial [Candidatus Micrarchaeota archaeon]|nr:hypothetical protein [Candidatus Micrarchaeota archaeon]
MQRRIGLAPDPVKAALYNSCKAAGCLDSLPSLSTANCNDYAGCKPENNCPTECRVNFTSSDTNYGTTCKNPDGTLKCASCPDFCKATPPNQTVNPACAPFPLTSNDNLLYCQNCPIYCRYGSAAGGLNTTYEHPYPLQPSQGDLTVNQTDPFEELCFRNYTNAIECNPTYCSDQCRNAWWPATCEAYSPGSGLPCANCTANCRVNISYGYNGNVLLPNTFLCPNYTSQCYSLPISPNKCRGECLNQVVLPTPAENPVCYNFNNQVPPASPNTNLSSPYTPPSVAYPLLTAATNPPVGSEALDCQYCPVDCRYGNLLTSDPRCHVPFVYQFKSDYTAVLGGVCDSCNAQGSNSCYCDISLSALNKTGPWYYPGGTVYLRWPSIPSIYKTDYSSTYNTTPAKPANGLALLGQCKMAPLSPYPSTQVCQSYVGSPPPLISLPSPPSAGDAAAANCKYCPTKCLHGDQTDLATDPACNTQVTYEFATQFTSVNSVACNSCNLQGETSCYCNPSSQVAGTEYVGSFTRNATCSAPVAAGNVSICSCRLQTGSLLTGQSPAQCRSCISNGGTNPCTCSPSSAAAGVKVSATKAQADKCGYTMPTSSTPPVASDVKDCIGYYTAPNTNQTAPLTYTIQYYQFMCKDYSYTKQPRTQVGVCSSAYGTCSDDCKDRVSCQDYYYTKQPRVMTNVCDRSYNVCPVACQKDPTPIQICKDYVGLGTNIDLLHDANGNSNPLDTSMCQQCPKILRIKG